MAIQTEISPVIMLGEVVSLWVTKEQNPALVCNVKPTK
jgi:hypothetical protein